MQGLDPPPYALRQLYGGPLCKFCFAAGKSHADIPFLYDSIAARFEIPCRPTKATKIVNHSAYRAIVGSDHYIFCYSTTLEWECGKNASSFSTCCYLAFIIIMILLLHTTAHLYCLIQKCSSPKCYDL